MHNSIQLVIIKNRFEQYCTFYKVAKFIYLTKVYKKYLSKTCASSIFDCFTRLLKLNQVQYLERYDYCSRSIEKCILMMLYVFTHTYISVYYLKVKDMLSRQPDKYKCHSIDLLSNYLHYSQITERATSKYEWLASLRLQIIFQKRKNPFIILCVQS